MRRMPKYTELEYNLDQLLSDGCRHSFTEIRKFVRDFRKDTEVSNGNVSQTIKKLRRKMAILEPQCEIVNTFHGYKGFWRKFRLLDDG